MVPDVLNTEVLVVVGASNKALRQVDLGRSGIGERLLKTKMDELRLEERFHRLNWLAAELLDVPMAWVKLFPSDKVIFHGVAGLPIDDNSYPHAFISFALMHAGVLVVPDASRDLRFCHEPLVVNSPFVRFFAATRLLSVDGTPFGGLCVMDTEPRMFRLRERRAFEGLAMIAADFHQLCQLERRSH